MTSTSADSSLYFFRENNLIVVLILYVDDLLITGNHLTKITWLQEALQQRFRMSYLGLLTKYLGIEFTHTPTGLTLHQTEYATSIIEEHGLLECNPTKTPLPSGFTISKQTKTPLVDPTSYRSLIGKLMFLTTTRPDITFAVNLLSQFNEKPQMAHFKALKQILRYIKGTLSIGLTFSQTGKLSLTGHSDVDWGGDVDQRKSTGAYVFTVNDTPVTWSTKKQTCIVLSSTESEYRSLVEATKEAMWIRNLLKELGYVKKGSIVISCDNQSAIKISQNPMYHSKTKHFEIHLNYVRDMVDKKKIAVVYISNANQPADILTKSLGKIKFDRCKQLLRLCNPNDSSSPQYLPLTSSS
jgi:hypothetical protein